MIPNLSKTIYGCGVGLSTPILARKSHLRTILFASPPGTISGAIDAAIEREFSWISVRHVPELHLACIEPETRTQLILIDLRLVPDLELHQVELAKHHPSAAIAIMIDSNTRVMENQLHKMDAGPMRGVLPLNVNLDVLLSILHIMLKGGDYFPAPVFRTDCDHPAAERAGGQINGDAGRSLDKGQKYAGGEAMIELTTRELEILAKVAKGNQNKIIAADLGVSEHTVKIHIHNIITKLGVHNRTEAAILYLERTGGDTADINSAGLRRPPDD